MMVGIFQAWYVWYINMRILSLQPIMDVFLASKFVDKILWSKEKNLCGSFFYEYYLLLRSLQSETYWGHHFYISYRRQDHHFKWSSEPREGPAICRVKLVPSFLSYVETLSIGLVLGIKPATSRSRSAVKCSSNWANPATFRKGLRKLTKEQGFLSYCFASLSIASLTQGINSCERWDR